MNKRRQRHILRERTRIQRERRRINLNHPELKEKLVNQRWERDISKLSDTSGGD